MAKCQNPDCEYFHKPIPDEEYCPFCGQAAQPRSQLRSQLAGAQPKSEMESVKMESQSWQDSTQDLIPGEMMLAETPIVANVGRRTLTVDVTNTGDRPVQVGSHYHFFEVNRGLLFDRAASFGMRLNIPSGNAVRFEPGQTQQVTLVELSGKGVVYGLNSLTQGSTRTRSQHLKALQGYQNWQEGSVVPEVMV